MVALSRLTAADVTLWPILVSDDRWALVAHAEHLAALRDAPDAV